MQRRAPDSPDYFRKGMDEDDDLNMRDSAFDPMGRATPERDFVRRGQPIDDAEAMELGRKLG